jgi:hypothetical protein
MPTAPTRRKELAAAQALLFSSDPYMCLAGEALHQMPISWFRLAAVCLTSRWQSAHLPLPQ